MTHTFDSEVSLQFGLLWPTVWRGGAEGRWRLAARTRCSGLNWAMGESKVVEAARSEQSSRRRLLQSPSCPLPPLGGASVVAKKTGRAPLEEKWRPSMGE